MIYQSCSSHSNYSRYHDSFRLVFFFFFCIASYNNCPLNCVCVDEIKQGTLISRLKAHQYTIQKSTHPACACGHSYENTNYFILDCPLFTSQRTDLFTKISLQLNIDMTKLANATKWNILLFGHEITKKQTYPSFWTLPKISQYTFLLLLLLISLDIF